MESSGQSWLDMTMCWIWCQTWNCSGTFLDRNPTSLWVQKGLWLAEEMPKGTKLLAQTAPPPGQLPTSCRERLRSGGGVVIMFDHLNLKLLGSSHPPTLALGGWSCRCVLPCLVILLLNLGKPPDPGHTGGSGNLFGGQLSCASPFIHRVFGNCWDSDEDTPTRPQPQDCMPKMPDFDGYCNHNEEGPNGETEAQRWTATRQGQPAMAIALKGENPRGCGDLEEK